MVVHPVVVATGLEVYSAHKAEKRAAAQARLGNGLLFVDLVLTPLVASIVPALFARMYPAAQARMDAAELAAQPTPEQAEAPTPRRPRRSYEELRAHARQVVLDREVVYDAPKVSASEDLVVGPTFAHADDRTGILEMRVDGIAQSVQDLINELRATRR